jgi:hypothetical protein
MVTQLIGELKLSEAYAIMAVMSDDWNFDVG